MPSSTVRSHPQDRFKCAIRPSEPVRHLIELAKARRELDLLTLGAGPAPSRDGDVLDTHGLELGLHLRFAIAAIGGDRLGHLAEELRDPGDGRSEHGGIGRVALLHHMVEDDALDVVGDLRLVSELDGTPESSLGMGRASVSCSDTTRSAPAGTSPARRVRVWATICSTAQMVRSSSFTRAVALPDAASPARRSARRAFVATNWASLMAASAIRASSPVSASTSSLASPLRRRSHAAI